MHNQKIIPFKITGMDSLGQGVSKESDKITFIPKTAIGDEGDAWVQSEKKVLPSLLLSIFRNRLLHEWHLSVFILPTAHRATIFILATKMS